MHTSEHTSSPAVPTAPIMSALLPTQLESLSWVVFLLQDDDPHFVQCSVSKILTKDPAKAERMRKFCIVEEELAYWHDKNREGYKPFHRTASFTLDLYLLEEVVNA